MRKPTFVTGALLVAIVAAGWALLLASGLPLPWRGALTRHAYVELLRGRLPMLACAERMALSTDPGITCDGLARDSLHGVEVFVRDRRVESLAHVWWRADTAGHVLVDSLMRAVNATRGPALRCPPRQPGYAGGSATPVAFLWPAAHDDAAGVLLRVTQRVPWSSAGPDGWAVSLRSWYGLTSCDMVP